MVIETVLGQSVELTKLGRSDDGDSRIARPPFRRTIRRTELHQLMPLADTTIYDMERRGEFPRPVSLKAGLDRYTELHTQTYGERVDAATLIPHMLGAFRARDWGFAKISHTKGAA